MIFDATKFQLLAFISCAKKRTQIMPEDDRIRVVGMRELLLGLDKEARIEMQCRFRQCLYDSGLKLHEIVSDHCRTLIPVIIIIF